MIDGKKFAREGMDAAVAQVLQAYYKAPQITSRVKLQSMVLDREGLKPMMEVIEALEGELGKESVANLFMPIYMDYMCYKDLYDQDSDFKVLVLGANLTTSELMWDCGGCGFASCAEFNKYSKEHGGMGKVGGGPSCVWKTMDYSIAVDYACACAHQLNLENRIQGTFGGLAYLLGYLEDASMVLTLPLVPLRELWFYNRPSMPNLASWAEISHLMRCNYTIMFQMFSSNANPPIKDDGPWWEKAEFERDLSTVFHSENLEDLKLQTGGKLLETVIDIRMRVQQMKEEKMGIKAG
ncbi:MAG: hypothetical protein JRI97_02040 [Deltaproteobacteria bacterium]|nr:hypothetical protein [Deltaproteobacteria bacterium]